MTLELFGHPFSSYTWKSLIALYETATPFTFRNIAGDEYPENEAAFLAHWPVGKFPLLVEDGVPIMRESEVIERLRRIATAPGARGLLDDVAVLDGLVLTHDSIAEGVHFLSSDPAASVGWKLVAVNLSDLAAKGATPAGALLSLTISGPGEWEQHFIDGVEAACESYGLPLLGGDTIKLPVGAPRVLGLTTSNTSALEIQTYPGSRVLTEA